jgi:hypothetical protein
MDALTRAGKILFDLFFFFFFSFGCVFRLIPLSPYTFRETFMHFLGVIIKMKTCSLPVAKTLSLNLMVHESHLIQYHFDIASTLDFIHRYLSMDM